MASYDIEKARAAFSTKNDRPTSDQLLALQRLGFEGIVYTREDAARQIRLLSRPQSEKSAAHELAGIQQLLKEHLPPFYMEGAIIDFPAIIETIQWRLNAAKNHLKDQPPKMKRLD